MKILNEKILPKLNGVSVYIKREDLIHPFISGNKYRKLKYNLQQARQEGKTRLLTFGGAYSNHIAAVAHAGKLYGLETTGIIRGEELSLAVNENPTLSFASQNGMKLEFINREDYRRKNEPGFINALKSSHGDFYLLPEGGTNALAVKGCEEILTPADSGFDYICCAVGTGGTLAGIINSASPGQNIIGFAALKGDFLSDAVRTYSKNENWVINSDYHFGGYAKVNTALVDFMNEFRSENKIALDPVYTGKMLYGIADLAKKEYFPRESKILVIHTGGLQGIDGMNLKLKNKNMHLSQNG